MPFKIKHMVHQSNKTTYVKRCEKGNVQNDWQKNDGNHVIAEMFPTRCKSQMDSILKIGSKIFRPTKFFWC